MAVLPTNTMNQLLIDFDEVEIPLQLFTDLNKDHLDLNFVCLNLS